ncbi:MAG: hypothetical protein WAU70_12130 [Flavobacteriales bacterium]
MKRVTRWLIATGIAATLCAILLYFAHPWLAITERSGGKVMVVEGWMDDDHVFEAARLFKEGGYERVYTTGTTRPFAYYLSPGERIGINALPRDITALEMGVAGLPACSVVVVSGGDTLLHVPVSEQVTTHGIDRKDPLVDLRIIAEPPYPQPGPPSIFIHSLRLNGHNAHDLGIAVRILMPDSTVHSGEPTYAEHCARVLEEAGIAHPAIETVPAGGDPVSRSWANAATLAFHLKGRGITALDVVTLGIHARRSRALYQEALGQTVVVGVIALPDPECPADGWWKSGKGWYFMLKELAGSQEARAVEVSR